MGLARRALTAASGVWVAGLALLLLALAPPARGAEGGLEILGVAHEREGEGLRLAFRVDGDPAFSLFTLVEPWRVVIDLPPFDWRAEARETARLPGIRALRHGLFRHDTGRIVIELDRPMAVRRAGLVPVRGGFALEIALAPTGAAAFAETAGWPEGARWSRARRIERAPEGQVVVAIDPGHGGIDPGASLGGLLEKDIVLAFGHVLAARIAAFPGLYPVMTRVDDRFLPLRERIKIAREAGAHVFVSLHTDSLASGEADGASLYTLDRRGTDSAAEAFAERENRADVLAGVDLAGEGDDVARLLVDLARRGSKAESIKLADLIVEALDGRVKLLDTRPHRRGNFFVLKAPDLPSVLVELGFLTSALDRERLQDPAWRRAMAEGIATGIARWVAVASPGFLAPRG